MSGSKNSSATSKLLDNLTNEQEKHNASFNNGHGDLFNYDDDLTGGDPDFYNQNNSNDIYDFSNVRPSLLLDTSSNNPTDDEEEG
jgi:hypothetical protein